MSRNYTHLRRAFDDLAPAYDAAYGREANQMMAWMRGQNLALLRDTFEAGSHLLEIGCGTGDEALALAREGWRVTATDISPRMAALTRRKAAAAGLDHRVSAAALAAGQLQALKTAVPFDGAYASFGCLNCEPNLAQFARSLAGLVKAGAPFVCTVMARLHPWEMLWYLAHAQPERALRRLKPGWQKGHLADGGGGRITVGVRYLTSRELQKMFRPYFAIQQQFSLGLLLPPPSLDGLFKQDRAAWRRLEALERRLRTVPPWREMGDHIALVMRKNEDLA